VRSKIVYIAHPIAGDVAANLASIRTIVKYINLSPKYSTVVPFVPYYCDVVSMDDNVPTERERGLKNGQQIISRPGMIDELWLCGKTISPGMKQEAFAAWKNRIPVKSFGNLFTQLEAIKEEWKNSQ
jgi:hypothetical protein